MKNNYNLSDLSKCWDKLNIKKGDLIYVTGDLSYLGSYYNRKKILNDYYKTLSKAVGKNGTIAFPTEPSCKITSASIVGFPLLSKTCLA